MPGSGREVLDAQARHAADSGIVVGKYMLGMVIGKGLSSEVRLATDMHSDKVVALKILQKDWIWKNDMSTLVRREIEIMRELDHPSVVKLIEVFNSETHVFISMEAVDGRELHEEISRNGKLDEDRARGLFMQVMDAVKYIHSLGVAHRDIKLENLLLSKDGKRVKVTDFGLAARLDEWEGGAAKHRRMAWGKRSNNTRRQQVACGTLSYAAPEIISSENQGYDARGVDIWCVGVVLFTIVTGHMPFQGKDVDATLELIRTAEPSYPKHLSPEVTDLLRGMLTKDPAKRLSVPKVLAHSWSSPVSVPLALAAAHMHPVEGNHPPLMPRARDAKRLNQFQFASAPSGGGGLRSAAMREAIETAAQAASEAGFAEREARAAESIASLLVAALNEDVEAASEGSSPAMAGSDYTLSSCSSSSSVGVARRAGGALPTERAKLTWGSTFARLFGCQSWMRVEASEDTGLASSSSAATHGEEARNRILHSQFYSTAPTRDRAWSMESYRTSDERRDGSASLLEGGGNGVEAEKRRHSVCSVAYSSKDGEANSDGHRRGISVGSYSVRDEGVSREGLVDGGDGGVAGVFAATASSSSTTSAVGWRNLADSRRQLLSRSHLNGASSLAHTHGRPAAAVGSYPPTPVIAGTRTASISTKSSVKGSEKLSVLGGNGGERGRGFEGSNTSFSRQGGGSESLDASGGRLAQSKPLPTIERSLSSPLEAIRLNESIPSSMSFDGASLAGRSVAFDIYTTPESATTVTVGNADDKQAARGSKVESVAKPSLPAANTTSMSPLLEGPETSGGARDVTITSIRPSGEHSSSPTSPSTPTVAVDNLDVVPEEAPPSSPGSAHKLKALSTKDLPAKELSMDESSTDASSAYESSTYESSMYESSNEPLPLNDDLTEARSGATPEDTVDAALSRVADAAASGRAVAIPNPAAASVVDAVADDTSRSKPSDGPKSRLPEEDSAPRPELSSSQKKRELSPGRMGSSGRGASPKRDLSQRRSSARHERTGQRSLSPRGRPSPGRRSLSGRRVSSPGRGLLEALSESPTPAPKASPKRSPSPTRSASWASLQRERPSSLAQLSSPTKAPAWSGGQHQGHGRTLERTPRSSSPRQDHDGTGRSQQDGALTRRSTASLSPSTLARAPGCKPEMDVGDGDGTKGSAEVKRLPAITPASCPASVAVSPKPSRSIREAAAAANIWGGDAPAMRSTSCGGINVDSSVRRHFSYAGTRRAESVGRTSRTRAPEEEENPRSQSIRAAVSWARCRGKEGGMPELGRPSSKFEVAGADNRGGSRGAASTAGVVVTSGKQDGGGDVAADTKKFRKRGKAFGRAVARIFGRRDNGTTSTATRSKGSRRRFVL